MADWHSAMEQTFEYYTVDPISWLDVKKLDGVSKCKITRDKSADTLGSATLDYTGNLGESYVRIYLSVIQNGITERFPLATVLVQTPSLSYDGMKISTSLDAYTPLIELKENKPPLGYFTPEKANIMEEASRLVNAYARAPIVGGLSEVELYKDFVSNTDDTWLTYIRDMVANAKFYFSLDEMGRILFAPKQETASLQPVWTYTDDNCSILYSDISLERDFYSIPNVVEVVYSDSNDTYYAIAVNDSASSPVSTVSRGRRITARVENPDIPGVPTQGMIDEYAETYLKEVSTFEYTVRYSHGYCPVRLDDCVRLNIASLGLSDVKARVTNQSIECEAGCKVTETAVFTQKLWR